MNALDRAVDGAENAPLTREQKRDICRLARRAWEKQGRPFYEPSGIAAGDPLALSAAEACELWRHETTLASVGLKHLTACGQRHFAPIMGLFSGLAGLEKEAGRWRERAAFSSVRAARIKFERTLLDCARWLEQPRAYAAAIARRQYGADLEDLSARQLWSLVYTLRNRSRKRARRPVAGSEERGAIMTRPERQDDFAESLRKFAEGSGMGGRSR